jgi:HAMP domain-containing protein/HPt (histidine-containing phosphotransfer) domain-containing protein/two-component sensor histidine kinase
MWNWKFGIARKLAAVCLAFGLPIVVMFVLMTKAKLAEIEFAAQELKGDAFQRPLEEVLRHVSQHERLWVRSQRGETSLGILVREEEAAILSALGRVDAAHGAYGRDLQFTEAGLGLRNRNQFTAAGLRKKWAVQKAKLASDSIAEARVGYRAIFLHVRTMITHAGDSSNLILDPDLDSYYLMDVTLLALPQMKDRVRQIATQLDDSIATRSLSLEGRTALATLASFLKQADWDRVAASTSTALAEDRNFHGSSPTLARTLTPHLSAGARATERVVAGLRALAQVEAVAEFDTVGLRGDLETLDAVIYSLHGDALDEEDRLLQKRISDLRGSLYVGFALAALSLVISVMLSLALASNIVRRVRRISAMTDAFAKGDMQARVGHAGADELGELARAFDSMTDRIGGLAAEVQQRSDELLRINGNLEAIVEERTRQLQSRNDAFRLILDNAHDGMITVDTSGVVSMERSATMDRWFGAPESGSTFIAYIAANDPTLAAELELGLAEVWADFLPIELTLDQLPRKMVVNDTHLRLNYTPILEDGKVSRLLVILADVTSEIEARRAAVGQEEMLRIFQAYRRDRSGCLDFFVDARELVRRICSSEERSVAEVVRLVHTLKGNCALFGVLSMSGLCHDVEHNLEQTGGVMSVQDTARFRNAWDTLSTSMGQMMGEPASDKLEVGDDEYAAIVHSITSGVPRREILDSIAKWKLEPTERQLGRFADRAKLMARGLGKEIEIAIESNDMRLCADTWAPIWSVLSHVIRNAVDHGIESGDERIQNGKAASGRVRLGTRVSDSRISIEVSDDGRGIAWDSIALKAQARSLPFATPNDLVEALFADGLSTKEVVTNVSGRGVGMSAVRQTCRDLGGEVDIESEPGKGTTIRCSFPEQAMSGRSADAGARRAMISLHPPQVRVPSWSL